MEEYEMYQNFWVEKKTKNKKPLFRTVYILCYNVMKIFGILDGICSTEDMNTSRYFNPESAEQNLWKLIF